MFRDHFQSGTPQAFKNGDAIMPHPADVAVGKRLRLRRKELGLSQIKLARDIEINVYRLRRYERGEDRMRTRDLFRAARRLGVPIGYFFRELGARRELAAEPSEANLVSQGLQLLKIFCAIPDSDARAQLIQLARHASREETSGRHA
jgi:transcriptional regulator with XRE-family HTH domain